MILTPVVNVADSNALAKRFGGRAPIFAGEIFGDQRNGHSVVRVGPAEVATSDERYAHRLEVSRRNKQEDAELVMALLRRTVVVLLRLRLSNRASPSIGHGAGKGDRRKRLESQRAYPEFVARSRGTPVSSAHRNLAIEMRNV